MTSEYNKKMLKRINDLSVRQDDEQLYYESWSREECEYIDCGQLGLRTR